jgi:hypothetical protein
MSDYMKEHDYEGAPDWTQRKKEERDKGTESERRRDDKRQPIENQKKRKTPLRRKK